MLKGGLQDGRRVYCTALYANVQLSAIILLYTNWPNTKHIVALCNTKLIHQHYTIIVFVCFTIQSEELRIISLHAIQYYVYASATKLLIYELYNEIVLYL